MSELDLVPASYRQRLGLRRAAWRFGLLYVLVGLTLVASWMALGAHIRDQSAVLGRLENDKHAALTDRARLDVLSTRQEYLERELRTLSRLGGAAHVQAIFDGVGAALADDVWFREWIFMRAGEFVEVGPRTVDTGYLILVPETADKAPQRAWRLRSHMEIRGQASSHSALAAFVQRLSGMALVGEVKILSTRGQQVSGAQVVDFELAVLVSEPHAAV